MIKVKDLIAILEKQDPERFVILQKKSEGKECSPLFDIWTGAYDPADDKSGTSYIEELTKEFEVAGYTEDDVCPDGTPALFLVPKE